MKPVEIRELTDKELEEKLDAEIDILQNMKIQHATSPLENPNTIKQSRRTIARIRTILKERKKNN
ncbi:MAG: 50S ribosomal protein L29 [Bacteroidales bacterium]|nr:50S ribosomal protein L29 [Bacteroidales bacterium]NLK81873.1 50S ribosomal protein L29 [Bacteroidales bacterium]